MRSETMKYKPESLDVLKNQTPPKADLTFEGAVQAALLEAFAPKRKSRFRVSPRHDLHVRLAPPSAPSKLDIQVVTINGAMSSIEVKFLKKPVALYDHCVPPRNLRVTAPVTAELSNFRSWDPADAVMFSSVDEALLAAEVYRQDLEARLVAHKA